MSNYRALPEHLIQRISTFNLWVLRHKDGTALNVSYTQDGLRWTCNKKGRALYYRNAIISRGKLVGDTAKASDVYVEKFVPLNHESPFKQKVESTWVDKALRLMY